MVFEESYTSINYISYPDHYNIYFSISKYTYIKGLLQDNSKLIKVYKSTSKYTFLYKNILKLNHFDLKLSYILKFGHNCPIIVLKSAGLLHSSFDKIFSIPKIGLYKI